MNNNSIYSFILSQSNNPNDSKILLKELLQLDNFLYEKISSVAVQYGNGTHPKHRLTKYHDFFVDNVEENESVIDLGSGRGDVTYDVANKTKGDVIGIEINKNNLDYARKTYKLDNLQFIYGNIYKDIPNRYFSVVILSNVLEHLDRRDDLLMNIVDKVRPCKILLRVPHFEREWIVPIKKEMGVNYFLDNTHRIEYTHEEFENEMKKSGLIIDKMQVNWGEIWAVCNSKR